MDRVEQASLLLGKGIGLEALDEADLPDAAIVMLRTRWLNNWLGTTYTLDEVEAMSPLTFAIAVALARGQATPRGE